MVIIFFVVGVAIHTQQSDRSGGITRRRGRVLNWLAWRRQRTERSSLQLAQCGVEEPSADSIEKALDHLICNALSEAEVIQVRGGFIGIEARYRRESIV